MLSFIYTDTLGTRWFRLGKLHLYSPLFPSRLKHAYRVVLDWLSRRRAGSTPARLSHSPCTSPRAFASYSTILFSAQRSGVVRVWCYKRVCHVRVQGLDGVLRRAQLCSLFDVCDPCRSEPGRFEPTPCENVHICVLGGCVIRRSQYVHCGICVCAWRRDVQGEDERVCFSPVTYHEPLGY